MNYVSGQVVDAAILIHKTLGPGLLESAYESCLAYELRERGLVAARQLEIPLTYKGVYLDKAYRLDLVVSDLVVVEVKAIEKLAPIHHAQLLSYLKLARLTVGLLINFNVVLLKDGLKRIVNNAPD